MLGYTDKKIADLKLVSLLTANTKKQIKFEYPKLFEEMLDQKQTIDNVIQPLLTYDHKYSAPELLSSENEEKRNHSYPVDIWSLGCLIYNMFTGVQPFFEATNWEMRVAIKAGEW